MIKKFEYLYTVTAQDSLELDDIGNTCIHILNDLGYEWYMIITTELGDTDIKTFGPFHVDMTNYFNNGFNFNLSRISYKESKICSIIDNFLNDPKKNISQAFECTKEEAYEKLCAINFKEMR